MWGDMSLWNVQGPLLHSGDHIVPRILTVDYTFNNVGMPYPGLPFDLKLHLWHTICRPILTFGLETVYLNRAMYGKLESFQGTIVKAFLGLSRYSHHSSC